MKRIGIFLLEIIAALAVCLFVGIGLLMARLEQGPVVLESSLSEIEGALGDLSPGLTFKIDQAQLESNEKYRTFRMRLQNVRIFNKEHHTVGALQDVVLGFNWRNLTGFTVMPVGLEMSHPRLTVTRYANGYVGFNLQENARDAEHAGSIADLSTFLTHIPKNLRHIQITDAALRYIDEEDKTSFSAKNGLFVFNRPHKNVSGTLSLDIEAGEFKQRIQGTIAQNENETANLVIALKDFHLDSIRGFIPSLPAEMKLDMPVDALLTTTFGMPLSVQHIELQISGKQGTLAYPTYFSQTLPISNLFAQVEYLPQEYKFHLQNLGFNLEQTSFLAVGSVVTTPDQDNTKPDAKEIVLKAMTENVPVDKLPVYWPQGLAHNARDWVTTHIRDGLANRGIVNLVASISADKEFKIKELGGRIDFEHATLDYLPPMHPVNDVSGQCRFTDQHFDVALTSGKAFDTKLNEATVRISDLLKNDPRIAIETDMTGPLHDGLYAISSKPLEYTQKLGVTPDNFSGEAHTHMKLFFPLLNDLKLDQIHVDITSDVQNLVAKNVVKDLSITAKSMALKVNEHELLMDGDAQLADAANHVTWHEYFTADAPYGSVVDTKGAITAKVLKDLRLPLEPYFKGSAQSETHISVDNAKTTAITAKADLAQSEITLAELALQKKSGTAGKLDLNLTTNPQGVTTIKDSAISWNDFSIANAAITFSDANGIESAMLKDIRSGRSKAEIMVTPNGSNAVKAVIKADTLDLSGYWTKKKSIDDKPSTKKIDLNLEAKTLFLHPQMPLKDVRANVVTTGSDLHRGLIAATTDDGGTLALQQTENKDGSRHLAIKINNAGHVLQALDVTDAVRGGTLTVIGDSQPKTPSVIEGKMVMEKFNMVHAPVLARLINAMSPGGLLNLLNTSGLNFSKMESNYSLPDAKTIKVSKGKLTGDSLGLSYGGTINRENSTLDITGTIVPLQGINKLANIIPVLGKVLTGLNGNGIIGATYHITGPTADPSVSVNPLSALTPGILRSILFENSND